MTSFKDGLAAVATGRKYGFISSNGQFVIPAQYDYAEGFRDGAAKITFFLMNTN